MPIETTTLTPGQIIQLHQKKAPVDVSAIARALGINVWEMHNLATNISGKIFRDKLNGGATGYSIGVNASEGFRRKRFTVAHEIAHYILHLDKIGDELTDDAMYRSGLSTREEVQANNLAADIIMPISLIRQLQGLGMDSVSALADALQVSEPAMRVRLSYL
jgi:Zn-dependent peptidase ImmA (M78 family)